MKTLTTKLLLLFLVLTTLTSCELIGDIFQAGVGVGIFIVVAVWRSSSGLFPALENNN